MLLRKLKMQITFDLGHAMSKRLTGGDGCLKEQIGQGVDLNVTRSPAVDELNLTFTNNNLTA